MKRLTLSKIFGGVLLGTLLLGCGVAMGGCQEPVIDSSSNSGSSVIEEINAEKVNEMLAALPDKNAFESKNIPDLETVINYYNQLSDGEKELVTYTKIEELLALPIYLDDQVKEYIPQSVETFELNPYLNGKKVTSVILNGNKLFAGQYIVNENSVTIEEYCLKDCIPSVMEVEILTDVSAKYTYRIFAGMRKEEVLFINADNKNIDKTLLQESTDNLFSFDVEKTSGFSYVIYFSNTEQSLQYTFEEGREYNLYFDFSIPTNAESVALPIYFEGIGGELGVIEFLNEAPILVNPSMEENKKITISYLGEGVYRFYAMFEAEEGCTSLVIGLEGADTRMKMDNISLYPICEAPALKEKAYDYDVTSGTSLDIPINLNGGEITSVKLADKEVPYEVKNGKLQLQASVFTDLKQNVDHDLEISNRFGTVSATVCAYDGLPIIVGADTLHYSSNEEGITFTVDCKGKNFKELRLNNRVIDQSEYEFDGEKLTIYKSYLDTLYSDNVIEMKFSDSKAELQFTVTTNYIYKSNFETGKTSDSDLNFAPDGTGKVIYDSGKYWANYYNRVNGTMFVLNTNTFEFEEEQTYEVTFNLKFRSNHTSGWWSPIFTGSHDLLYIRTNGAGVLTKDNVYPASNPLSTVYSYDYNGEYYKVSLIFTARSKGLSPVSKLEFASWDGVADVLISDLSIAEYSEKIDVLLMGSDILASGYWGTYREDTSLYETVNVAKIGSNINYWMDEIDNLALDYRASKIVLSVGEQDLYSGKSAATVIAEYKALIDKIKEVNPTSKLHILSMIKTLKYADKNTDIEKINNALSAYASEKNCKFVDITANIENSDGTPIESFYLSDGVHIARNEYGKISSEILKGCTLDGSLDTLFIGDSYMSVGYWHSYENDMNDINSVNLGVGGTKTTYWAEKVSELAEKYKASTIVVHIGVNDIDDEGIGSDLAIKRITALMNSLHEAFPNAEIYWMTISPNQMFASKNYLYPPVNEGMKAFAVENKWFKVIDIAPYFTGEDGKYLPEYYLSEGMHLNTAGYEVFVRELRKALGI